MGSDLTLIAWRQTAPGERCSQPAAKRLIVAAISAGDVEVVTEPFDGFVYGADVRDTFFGDIEWMRWRAELIE